MHLGETYPLINHYDLTWQMGRPAPNLQQKHEQERKKTETDTVEWKGKYKSLVKAEVSPLYSTVLILAAAPAMHAHMGSMM